MTLTSLNILSIVELIFYAPAIVLAIFLCARHGLRPRMGWLFLFIFCCIRIAEASLQLTSITHSSTSFRTSPITLSFVGVAPLLLTLLGLLNRLRIKISLEYPLHLSFKYLGLLRVLTIFGLICCSLGGGIAGGDFASNGVYKIFITTKIGVLILMGALAFMMLLTGIFASKVKYLHGPERNLLIAIGVSLPLLIIRLLFAVLCAWTNKDQFKVLGGSVAVMGCMSVLEEFLVVIIWQLIGLSLPKIPKEEMVNEKMKVVELWERFNARCCGHRKPVSKLGAEDFETV